MAPPTAAPPSVNFVPIGEFLARPDPVTKWVVKGLLPTGGTSLLASKPRAGKSTFVRSLLVSVARGEPFLGLSTAAVPVAYLCLEEIDSMVKSSFLSLGATAADPIFIHTGTLNPATAASEVADFIQKAQPGLVVVDTLGKFLPILDFNDYGRVNELMSSVTSMLRQFPSTHLMYLHHSTKTSVGEDDYLGSVAFHGNVDVFFRMWRSTDKHYLVARQQRYGIDFPQTELTIHPVTNHVIAGSYSIDTPARPDIAIASSILDAVQGGLVRWADVKKVVKGKASRLIEVRNDLIMKGLLVIDDDNNLSVPSPT